MINYFSKENHNNANNKKGRTANNLPIILNQDLQLSHNGQLKTNQHLELLRTRAQNRQAWTLMWHEIENAYKTKRNEKSTQIANRKAEKKREIEEATRKILYYITNEDKILIIIIIIIIITIIITSTLITITTTQTTESKNNSTSTHDNSNIN